MSEGRKAADVNVVDDFSKIQDWLYFCWRKWYWFLISLAIMFGLATLYLIRTTPIYTRKASILIKEDANNQSLSAEFSQFSSLGNLKNRTNLYNEMITLQSPYYMLEVVKNLHLDMNYYIEGSWHNEVLYGKTLPVNVSIPYLEPEETASLTVKLLDDAEIEMADFVLNGEVKGGDAIVTTLNTMVETPIGNVCVTPTKSYVGKYNPVIHVTRSALQPLSESLANRLVVELNDDKASVVDLKFEDVSPERAEDILNNLFVVYNQKWIEDINKQAESTAEVIDKELRKIEQELGNLDADISSYKSQNLVPDVNEASAIYMQRAESTSSMLLNLNNQLHMATFIRKQLNNDRFEVLPPNSGLDNTPVASLIATYNTDVNQRNSLVANSGANNPLVQDLDKQLLATKQAIMASLDNMIVNLKNQISNLRGNEAQTKSQIQSNPTQAKYLLGVERTQKVKEQQYIFLLQKQVENQLSKAYTAYNSKMLNPPTGSNAPSKPVRLHVMLIALAIGLVVPMAVLLIIKNLDTAVHTRKDLESLSIPFVGEIPLSYKKHRGLFSLFNKKKEVREIVVREKSNNVINEAFRVVRTNLEFVTGGEGQSKVIMFTSANPGSGKTYISANLATSFAIKGKHSLIIDLDMRKSSLSNFVALNGKGVADYLSGHVQHVDEIIAKGNIHENLDVIPVGTTPPNPTELLFSDRLELLIKEMKEKYDFIFIDCPPIDIVADASIITKHCDMTVFVIRSGLFDRSMLPDVERNYVEKRFNNMVLLLNGLTDEGTTYATHRYGYGYGYGYVSDKK